MKSKASYFSISVPLIKENLRRFWAIPVLAFLVYFLSGIFPILMSYGHLNNMARYIEMSLNNQQPFYMMAHLMFPIITAVIIFRYLQSVSSVSVMHSMPFTRSKLYNSGYVSGLILILVPILLNGLILLAISKPVYSQYGTETGLFINPVNLFTRSDILNWIWVSIVIVIVIYAVSVFAGIVTGNSLMHFAMAGFFNFLIPALYAIFIAYFSHYLYGFDTSGSWLEVCMDISPFLNAIESGGEFGIGVTIYYLITFLLLYVITGFLYQKRKLEHATDSLAFGFMEPIICFLIAFLGMTMLGFYFDVLGESELYMYAGLVAGTIIFFTFGQMIVKKTPRIFNIRSLRSFGIYVLIAIVFIVCLNVDATGFERRVPSPKSISSFTFTDSFNYNYSTYKHYLYSNNALNLEFKDPENITAITALHQTLIAMKNSFEKIQYNTYNSSFKIEYNSGSAFPMNRRYNIDYEFFRSSPEFKQLYESKEFKEFNSLTKLQYEKLSSIYINTEWPYNESIEVKTKNQVSELMKCMEKDFQAQTFEDMVSLRNSYAISNINFTYKDVESDTPERILDGSISFKITRNSMNTIKWLEEHGYDNRLAKTADKIQYIELFHYVRDDSQDEPKVVYVEDRAPTQGKTSIKSLKITDPEEIQTILDTYETQNINYNDYYYGTVVFVGAPAEYSEYMIQDPYSREMYDKYQAASMNGMNIYFNKGNIPNYVLEYFK